MPTEATETTFEQEVLAGEGKVVVDFWAEWCGPCHAVAPVLDRIADDHSLKIVKVNIDEEQGLAQRYGVASIPMSGWLLVNPRSGVGSAVGEVRAAAAGRGLETHVLQPGEDATMVARRARAEALGCAGGDGTVAAVAAVAVERDLPFVCVPFGTRNHFARDLGLDRADPIAALDAFGGTERRIDVGRANGRLFLNNVSIGAYAVLVDHGWRRASTRSAFGTGSPSTGRASARAPS